MRKNSFGFSVVELLIVVVLIAVVGGVGYRVYKNNHKATPASSASVSQSATSGIGTAQPGTTQAIDNVTNSAISSASTIDSQYTTSYQSTAQSSNTAASNLGGAYNESSF